MNVWQPFLRALKPVQQITLVNTGEQMGPHKTDWLAFHARKRMGRAWVCHPANWITSPAQRERQELVAAAVHRLTQPNNVRSFVRKKAQS